MSEPHHHSEAADVRRLLKQFLDTPTSIHPGAYVHPRAVVLGDVRLADLTSVWPSAVLRGDINFIAIGEGSNIQDGAIVHLSEAYPTVIGKYVTVGNSAVIHACTIEDECLIGMHSTILDGAVIGRQSIIGAGALVPQGMIVPPGSMVLGVPGKVVKVLDDERRSSLKSWAERYVQVSRGFKERGL
jgi:carbonic anhydrase/acetyltransferase-like protein (isoleucine patch superfamily)